MTLINKLEPDFFFFFSEFILKYFTNYRPKLINKIHKFYMYIHVGLVQYLQNWGCFQAHDSDDTQNMSLSTRCRVSYQLIICISEFF